MVISVSHTNQCGNDALQPKFRLFVVVFTFLWVRCGKRKEEKAEEKGSNFIVVERG